MRAEGTWTGTGKTEDVGPKEDNAMLGVLLSAMMLGPPSFYTFSSRCGVDLLPHHKVVLCYHTCSNQGLLVGMNHPCFRCGGRAVRSTTLVCTAPQSDSADCSWTETARHPVSKTPRTVAQNSPTFNCSLPYTIVFP